MTRRRWQWLLGLLALFSCFGAGLAAQEIGTPRWGFDGTAVIGRFNLVIVEVHNPTERASDKHLILSRSHDGLTKGADLVQRCYLAAGARRTMHFHPFVESYGESWTFSWAEGGAARQGVPSMRFGPPAVVFLERDSALTRRMLIRRFDPADLPTSATAMDCLGAVVLDRMPEMQQRQRQALVDWVRGGGTVHRLLRLGRYAALTDELTALDSADNDFAFGSGRVRKHAIERGVLSKKLPIALMGGYKLRAGGGESPVETIRTELRTMVTTDHNWGLIFLLSLVYLALIGPLFYRLNRQELPWHLGMLGLAATIGLATWLFSAIGARGYNEADSVHAVHYARALGQDQFEVTSYANVFLTQGALRDFAGSESYGLFSSGQVRERVGGEIHNGTQSHYQVDMPRFSHRLIVHQRQLTGEPYEFEFLLPRQGRPARIRSDLDIRLLAEVVGTKIYAWRLQGDHWVRGRVYDSTSWQMADIFSQDGPPSSFYRILSSRMCLDLRDPAQPMRGAGWHSFFVLSQGAPASFQLTGEAPEHLSQQTIYHLEILK